MATTNVALRRPTTANSSISPYDPSRVVDGNITTPASRWLTNKLPGWLQVNLGSRIYVDRWVVRHLSSAGWSMKYCLPTYSLQLSQDGTNWITVDSVTGNTASFTDRSFPAAYAAYARVVVNSAMPANTALASLLEFELYNAAATSGKLTSLVFNSGALVPPFSPTVTSYAQQVGFSTNSLTVTATPEDSQATVAVNGVRVVNGQPSAPIALNVGSNTITVAVTPVVGPVNSYVTTVTRADSAYLTALTMQSGNTPITLAPPFAKATGLYTASVGYDVSTVTLTPTAESATATIKVNGTVVASAGTSGPISLNVGSNNTITVAVTTPSGVSQNYTITVTRADSSYLSTLTIKSGMSSFLLTPTFDSKILTYTSAAGTKPSAIVTPTAQSPTATITVNGTPITAAAPSVTVPMSSASNLVEIKVTNAGVACTYQITISKP